MAGKIKSLSWCSQMFLCIKGEDGVSSCGCEDYSSNGISWGKSHTWIVVPFLHTDIVDDTEDGISDGKIGGSFRSKSVLDLFFRLDSAYLRSTSLENLQIVLVTMWLKSKCKEKCGHWDFYEIHAFGFVFFPWIWCFYNDIKGALNI